ncbi:hypothetical protein [Microbacterium sp. LWH3-1.2]
MHTGYSVTTTTAAHWRSCDPTRPGVATVTVAAAGLAAASVSLAVT